MAVIDDMKKLQDEDVVYLTRRFTGASGGPPTSFGIAASGTSTEVWRGRVRQALSGDWIFNAFTGQNGVVGFVLGSVTNEWSSSESPAEGINITISTMLVPVAAPRPGIEPLFHILTLTSVIPPAFAD